MTKSEVSYLDLLLRCIDVRADFEIALLLRNDYDLFMTSWTIGELAQQHWAIDLPMFNDPIFEKIVAAGRKLGRMYQSYSDRNRAHAERCANLPTAAELLQQAREQTKKEGDHCEILGYELWRERNGWSLTNAYGVDNSMFLRSERDFERLLAIERSGEDLGDVPPYCQDSPDEEVFEKAEDEFQNVCWKASQGLLESIIS